MTNLTQDHLDYHGTMREYALAKSRLFSRYMNPNYAVLNRDDEWYDFFRKRCVGVATTYGQGVGSDIQIQRVKLSQSGSSFTLKVDGAKVPVKVQLPGLFNTYNAAAAAGVGQWLGLDHALIADGLGSLDKTPGRMEPVEAGQSFAVIVDYAHAPDALQNALEALRQVTKGKLMIVFGATGDRDKSKRPQMGEVVGKLADRIFLTDDETYTEDPARIRAAVMKGIKKSRAASKTTEVDDREEAIRQAFAEARKGDTVLLAGIGHQNARNMGGQDIPWEEPQIAQNLLQKR